MAKKDYLNICKAFKKNENIQIFSDLQLQVPCMYHGCVWLSGQSHCSSQGQPGRRAFVLVLKTLHPALLAILRGEGQHSILFLRSWGEGFMKETAKMAS